ncbi:hypothetical protein I317_04897 [Kwoniella heveanensis CBS 569]|nr:hypothetical protein I317_04897 [Kwoniella heveanensis CBS 569]
MSPSDPAPESMSPHRSAAHPHDNATDAGSRGQGLPHRRPSLTLSPHLLPSSTSSAPLNIPVPRRHGSISSSRSPKSAGFAESLSTSPSLRRQSRGSFGSLSGSAFLPPPLFVSTTSGGSSGLYTRPGPTIETELLLGGDEWLSRTVQSVLESEDVREPIVVVPGEERVEQGVKEKELLTSQGEYIVVRCQHSESRYAFFDYADLNTFLLLVLGVTSNGASHTSGKLIDEEDSGDCHRRAEILHRLRGGEDVSVSSVCNVSGKNPHHSVPHDTTLRAIIQLFAKGVHWIAVTGPAADLRVLSHTTLLRHLLSLPDDSCPAAFKAQLDSRALGLPLHSLISLESSATVLDAMQTMSLCGVHALGVISGGQIGFRRDNATMTGNETSSYTSSPLLMAIDDDSDGNLIHIVRAQDCAMLVVPSVGKEALAMTLADMTKMVEQMEEAGSQRGEDRVPGE